MSRRRWFWITGLAVTLLVAAVLSGFASSAPDGLEWAAEDAGFGHTAEDSAVAGSPLADYAIGGQEGALSGGTAGIIGVAVTLVLAGGLAFVVRRRGRDTTPVAD
ncbi:PDGLE domain-containing protein [Blastococcus saxobsidens]|uniref:ABC-type Co2+ transport system, permease component n=1 Tax=Blastococcus saxobsidens (strain DD2) TaxID=1146883 RepID=H6RWL1_BLASD|nr:PDGLE domain-containing protein [Blastococcus saxobsidens]CCG04632.1 ABC-type Co2+ transport system, permease component [Blastococcus saxobsidens DD2]